MNGNGSSFKMANLIDSASSALHVLPDSFRVPNINVAFMNNYSNHVPFGYQEQ